VAKTPLTLIVDALREFVEQHAMDAPGPLDEGTRLFGRDGLLDSMGLVTLVVAVEQAIEDEYGVSVSLADDRALSQRTSPYRTVGSLAEYAEGLLGAAARG
jgi:acyl carrier protein